MEFPPELERQIFEYAAYLHPETRPTLTQVSKYVALWIEPILYEIVIIGISGERCKPSFSALQRCGQHVRHLLIGLVPVEPFSQYLVICPGVVNLAIWSSISLDDEAMNALRRLPLQRLCVHLESILDYEHPLLPQAQKKFISSDFSTLTHLDIASDSTPEHISPCLKSFPKLSHLSITRDLGNSRETVARYWKDIPTLEYIAVVEEGYSIVNYSIDRRREVLDEDIRVVRCLVPTFLDDWKRAARGDRDMWAYVKELIDARLKTS